jgi:hypothetical protein
MTSRLANRTGVLVLFALAVACVTFLAVYVFLTRTPGRPLLNVSTLIETPRQKTARLELEQSSKDWRAAQQRSDARNAAARARSLAADEPTAPK